jgi:hypothetical protein
MCPWKPPDKIWNPPNLLFIGYREWGEVDEEDLSLGTSALVVNLSTHLELVTNLSSWCTCRHILKI